MKWQRSSRFRAKISSVFLLNRELIKKPEVVALNKCDALDEKEINKRISKLEKACGKKVYPISAVARRGVFECLLDVNKYIKRDRKQKVEEEIKTEEPVKKTWSPI